MYCAVGESLPWRLPYKPAKAVTIALPSATGTRGSKGGRRIRTQPVRTGQVISAFDAVITQARITVSIVTIYKPVTIIVQPVGTGDLDWLGGTGGAFIDATDRLIAEVVRAHVRVIAVHGSSLAETGGRVTESSLARCLGTRQASNEHAGKLAAVLNCTQVFVKIAVSRNDAAIRNGCPTANCNQLDNPARVLWSRTGIAVVTSCTIRASLVHAAYLREATVSCANIAVIAIQAGIRTLAGVEADVIRAQIPVLTIPGR